MKHTSSNLRSLVSLSALSLVVIPLCAASCASGDSLPSDGAELDATPELTLATPDGAELSDKARAQLLMQRHMDRMAKDPYGTAKGRVVGLDGSPLAGVTVRIEDKVTATDATGAYELPDLAIGNHVVSFEHPSYVFEQRAVSIQLGDQAWMVAHMMPRSQPHHFNVEQGALIEEGPLTLEFEPQDLAFEDGLPVQGDVAVTVTAVDPRHAGHISAAPARLEGITASGQNIGLYSFGMLEVEIFQGARKVQVRPGQTVKTTWNLGKDSPIGAGETIRMWHHDTTQGVWVQERGVDALVQPADGKLMAVTELPHFSAWNFDEQYGSVCAVIRVPATQPVAQFKVISTDASGNPDGIWEFVSQCAGDSRRGAACTTDVPSGYLGGVFGGGTYFKFQVQAANSSTWTDLNITLNGGAQSVFVGSQINTWLVNHNKGNASWCGAARPAIYGGAYVQGTYNLSSFPSTLPTNTVRFGLPTTAASTVGAYSVSDVKFEAMRMNCVTSPYQDDFDRDGVNDSVDNCVGRSNPNQVDANGNGIGDVCETWCYVPDGPDASWYDADGDGIDDLCDTNWDSYNPSQYEY